MIKKTRTNDQIRVPKVRLISETGAQIGIVSIEEAMSYAARAEMDLVEVAPDANPPVCRIMDYGKYKYKMEISEKERKKKQTQITVKEVKIRPKIDKNDFMIKERQIEKFLKNGNKVKISMVFKGREVVHRNIGENLIRRLLEDLDGQYNLEQPPKFEGYSIYLVLSPA